MKKNTTSTILFILGLFFTSIYYIYSDFFTKSVTIDFSIVMLIVCLFCVSIFSWFKNNRFVLQLRSINPYLKRSITYLFITLFLVFPTILGMNMVSMESKNFFFDFMGPRFLFTFPIWGSALASLIIFIQSVSNFYRHKKKDKKLIIEQVKKETPIFDYISYLILIFISYVILLFIFNR